jgi:hypothetical protein
VAAEIHAMKKSPHGPSDSPEPDPCYLAWFAHFNACEYYEAHDALEVLWLRTRSGDRDFFKGLIQVAGAFVHLRKQREHPSHAKHSTRLRPAARLFLSGKNHIAPYGPRHLRLDVAAVCALCERLAHGIERSGFAENPWNPATPPHLTLAA